jgi:hypothetical protein
MNNQWKTNKPKQAGVYAWREGATHTPRIATIKSRNKKLYILFDNYNILEREPIPLLQSCANRQWLRLPV